MRIHSNYRSIPRLSALKLMSIFPAFSHSSPLWSYCSKAEAAIQSILPLNMSKLFYKEFTRYSNSPIKIAFRKVQSDAPTPSMVKLIPEISFFKYFKTPWVKITLRMRSSRNGQFLPSLHIHMGSGKVSSLSINNKKIQAEVHSTADTRAQTEITERESTTDLGKKSFEEIISEKITLANQVMTQRKNTHDYVKNYLQEKHSQSDFNIVDARNFDKIKAEVEFKEKMSSRAESESEAIIKKTRKPLQSAKKELTQIEQQAQASHHDLYNLLRLYVDKTQESISEIQKYHQKEIETPQSKQLLSELKGNEKEGEAFLHKNKSRTKSSDTHIKHLIEKIELFSPFFRKNSPTHPRVVITELNHLYQQKSDALNQHQRDKLNQMQNTLLEQVDHLLSNVNAGLCTPQKISR